MTIAVITNTETGKESRYPVTEREDGTLWANANSKPCPLLVLSHLPNAEALKSKYLSAIKSGQFDKINPEHFARFGKIGPFIIETAEDHSKRMRPIWEKKAKIRELEEAQTIEVYVSSRGWGDYSGITWRGNADRPTSEIAAECRALMAASNDVDEINQSDTALAEKIEKAKAVSIGKIAALKTIEEKKKTATAQREKELVGLEVKEVEEHETDEGGKTKTYRITVKINGREWVFIDRNVFDVGRCVNPAYAIATGHENGGLGVIGKDGGAYWEKFTHENGWEKAREMEPDEARAFKVVLSYYGHAKSLIRM